ncbi:MAG: hypothetical protein LBR92_02485 [Puniceicoccales bacterium]|jgi:hypothetical protein|nr:hypothetical protein [Puniceicoccales bacterium]
MNIKKIITLGLFCTAGVVGIQNTCDAVPGKPKVVNLTPIQRAMVIGAGGILSDWLYLLSEKDGDFFKIMVAVTMAVAFLHLW